MAELPLIRSHERIDFKRCPKKWYWKWRKGYVPRQAQFGALELGTWVHAAMAAWYGKGLRRNGDLAELFFNIAQLAIVDAQHDGAPDHVLDKAEELLSLGEAMMTAYQAFYKKDENVFVLGAEVPLEFTISAGGRIVAVHKLKPDLVFMDNQNGVWLMETKTAKSIRTEHLPIDDQARPYGAMAERALRRAGLLKQRHQFKGIRYNFIRKALPDLRPRNEQGKALNKNGSISKKQPTPMFERPSITLTNPAKAIALKRVQQDTLTVTAIALALRTGKVRAEDLPKTPHWSCPRHCQFWDPCKAEEAGTDIRPMLKALYIQRNPYTYDDEHPNSDEAVGFEMG